MNRDEQNSLLHCRHLIENKIAWGPHTQWTHQDFIRLSEMILEDTGVSLSTTTLKRVWGKVKYSSVPHITTLNALAQFAGYAHWRLLVQTHSPVAHVPSRLPEQPAGIEEKNDRRSIGMAAVWILLLMGSACMLGAFLSQTAQPQPTSYSFSGEAVAKGVPNTVLYTYGSSRASSDSIYLQPSGDSSFKAKVAGKAGQYAALHYYPGWVTARLLAEDDTVLEEKQTLITTEGWLAMIEKTPVPLYFHKNYRANGMLELTVQQVQDSCPDWQYNTPWVRYDNVQDFGGLPRDRFTFETQLRSSFSLGEAVCQDSTVTLLCQGGVDIVVPLTIPGCIGKVDAALKSSGMQSGTTNLRAFGCDFSDWVTVKCEAKNAQLSIWINHELAYRGSIEAGGVITGISYRFHGTGAVNSVSLHQLDGQEVYAEDFSA